MKETTTYEAVNRDQLLIIGFKELPYMTVMKNLIYDLGHNRHLNIGNLGTPNETIFICELDRENSKKYSDLVCVHNWDYDKWITMDKVYSLIHTLTGNDLRPVSPEMPSAQEFSDFTMRNRFKGDCKNEEMVFNWTRTRCMAALKGKKEPKHHYALVTTIDKARIFHEEHKHLIGKEYREALLKLEKWEIYDFLDHIKSDCIWGWKLRLDKAEQEVSQLKSSLSSEAVAFTEWTHNNDWSPLERNGKLVWIDGKKYTYLVNGSDHHYQELMKVGITTTELYNSPEFKEWKEKQK